MAWVSSFLAGEEEACTLREQSHPVSSVRQASGLPHSVPCLHDLTPFHSSSSPECLHLVSPAEQRGEQGRLEAEARFRFRLRCR